MHHMYYSGGIFDWTIGIMHLILPVIVIFLLYRIFSRESSHLPVQGYRQERDSLEILKKRYVKGEISREEFQRMKDEIRSL